jgi:hypothetical protein
LGSQWSPALGRFLKTSLDRDWPDWPLDPVRRALHEAGHVVVASVLGFGPLDASILRGAEESRMDRRLQLALTPGDRAAFLLAGHAAEYWGQGYADRGDSVTDLVRLTETGVSFAIALCDATALILAHWEVVDQVTRALLHLGGTLSADQLAALGAAPGAYPQLSRV